MLSNPYIAIPLYFIVVAIIVILLEKSKMSHTGVVFATLALIFIGVILGYIFVPQLAVACVVAGFGYSLFLTLSSIHHGN